MPPNPPRSSALRASLLPLRGNYISHSIQTKNLGIYVFVLDMCSKPIFCSKIALKGKTCSRLLKPQKVAPNAKSCSKVAEHNRDRPTGNSKITDSFAQQRSSYLLITNQSYSAAMSEEERLPFAGSLSIRRFWEKRGKMEAKKGESPSPLPLSRLKSPLPLPLRKA